MQSPSIVLTARTCVLSPKGQQLLDGSRLTTAGFRIRTSQACAADVVVTSASLAIDFIEVTDLCTSAGEKGESNWNRCEQKYMKCSMFCGSCLVFSIQYSAQYSAQFRILITFFSITGLISSSRRDLRRHSCCCVAPLSSCARRSLQLLPGAASRILSSKVCICVLTGQGTEIFNIGTPSGTPCAQMDHFTSILEKLYMCCWRILMWSYFLLIVDTLYAIDFKAIDVMYEYKKACLAISSLSG